MGISVYYRLRARADADRARTLVGQLRDVVARLPFDTVTDVFEHDPPDGRYEFERGDDEPAAAFWRPGDLLLPRYRDDGEVDHVAVPAGHMVFFIVQSAGAETATFGLASHPAVVVHRADVIRPMEGGGTEHLVGAGEAVEVPTRLRGFYSWQAAVKTQYAGGPKHGGPANFVRAHKALFQAVDAAKSVGIRARVRDDVDYGRDRDDGRLVAELARWDGLIAGFAGRVSDALGSDAVEAPIKDRPDFEQLEARGDAELRRLRGGE